MCIRYTMVYRPVRGDKPRTLTSGLSSVQVDRGYSNFWTEVKNASSKSGETKFVIFMTKNWFFFLLCIIFSVTDFLYYITSYTFVHYVILMMALHYVPCRSKLKPEGAGVERVKIQEIPTILLPKFSLRSNKENEYPHFEFLSTK